MWPFKRRSDELRKQIHIEIEDRWLRADALGFFGQYSCSPDGTYAIAWADRDPSGERGGFRESGHGTYLLAHDGDLVLTGKMERPNDGRVANNGSFVLNDWLFGEGLKGVFYAIHKNGNVLIRQRFEANLLNAGVSPDGAFAVCQTLASENEDSGQLCCFDLGSGSLLWKVEPETGWADGYSFDGVGQFLYLHYSQLGAFRYSIRTGSFEDRERWLDERTKHGNGFDLLTTAQARMKELPDVVSDEQTRPILELLQAALTRGLNDYPNQRAIVFRNMGELCERPGDSSSAVTNYEEAIRCNPKVGVKRRLDHLRRNLGR